MNLKHLTDQALLVETQKAVYHEKQATLSVLYHLREIERRRLFADLKLPSLFAYVTERLGYEESEAYRRISAMRLLTELPEIAPAVESGKLSLTHLNLVQSHFRKEQKIRKERITPEEKKDVLREIVGVSTRRAEKVIAEKASYVEPKTVTLEVDQALLDKLKSLKDLLAHSDPQITSTEFLHKLTDEAIKRLSVSWKGATSGKVRAKGELKSSGSLPALEKLEAGESLLEAGKLASVNSLEPRKLTSPNLRAPGTEVSSVSSAKFAKSESFSAPKKPSLSKSFEGLDDSFSIPGPFIAETLSPLESSLLGGGLSGGKKSIPGTSSVPVCVKRSVWERDQGKCTNCGSTRALEFDHFPILRSMGGKHAV